jgi:hypothetical protein
MDAKEYAKEYARWRNACVQARWAGRDFVQVPVGVLRELLSVAERSNPVASQQNMPENTGLYDAVQQLSMLCTGEPMRYLTQSDPDLTITHIRFPEKVLEILEGSISIRLAKAILAELERENQAPR